MILRVASFKHSVITSAQPQPCEQPGSMDEEVQYDSEAAAAAYAPVAEPPVKLSVYNKLAARVRRAITDALQKQEPLEVAVEDGESRAFRGLLGDHDFNDWLTDIAVERTEEFMQTLAQILDTVAANDPNRHVAKVQMVDDTTAPEDEPRRVHSSELALALSGKLMACLRDGQDVGNWDEHIKAIGPATGTLAAWSLLHTDSELMKLASEGLDAMPAIYNAIEAWCYNGRGAHSGFANLVSRALLHAHDGLLALDRTEVAHCILIQGRYTMRAQLAELHDEFVRCSEVWGYDRENTIGVIAQLDSLRVQLAEDVLSQQDATAGSPHRSLGDLCPADQGAVAALGLRSPKRQRTAV